MFPIRGAYPDAGSSRRAEKERDRNFIKKVIGHGDRVATTQEEIRHLFTEPSIPCPVSNHLDRAPIELLLDVLERRLAENRLPALQPEGIVDANQLKVIGC